VGYEVYLTAKSISDLNYLNHYIPGYRVREASWGSTLSKLEGYKGFVDFWSPDLEGVHSTLKGIEEVLVPFDLKSKLLRKVSRRSAFGDPILIYGLVKG
jgi:hypothetical protein